MRGMFSLDGPLFSVLNRIADLIILNLLFVVCCIPIVTIGASVTALSYVFLKMKEGREGYVVRSYFRAFKQNIKQATLTWLILLVTALILYMDWRMMSVSGRFGWMRWIILLGAILWMMIFLYVFPMMARFENTTLNMIRNSVLVALANAPRTMVMILTAGAAVFITLMTEMTFVYGILFWLLIGFSLFFWFNVQMLYKVFIQLSPPQEDISEGDDWKGIPEDDLPSEETDGTLSGTEDKEIAEKNAEGTGDLPEEEKGKPAGE